jgi:hypothetical protein
VLQLFRFPTVAALAAHLGGGEPPGPAGADAVVEELAVAGREEGRRRRREMRSELDPVRR